MNENRDLPSNDYYDDDQMTVKNWFFTLILLMIPLANIAFLIYWAFIDENCKESKKTYCQASLLVGCTIFVLYFVLYLLVFGTIISALH